MTLFYSFVVATFVTMVSIRPLIRLAERMHIVDLPADRKVHDAPVPRLGGLAMAVSAILPLAHVGKAGRADGGIPVRHRRHSAFRGMG